MAGRPSEFSEEKANLICDRLELGESLRSICADPAMPSKQTVLKWLRSNEAFVAQYAQARGGQAEGYAEEIVEIADTDPDPQRARVRIDARKWVAAKLLPKKYGERITTELTGKDGGAIKTEDVSGPDLARRIAFLLAFGAADKKD